MLVSIAGASGYAGGELIRILKDHSYFSLGPLAALSNAGEEVARIHPQFRGTEIGNQLFCETTASQLVADLVFLALPHGASAQLAAELISIKPDIKIVDLGADFRLQNHQSWNRYYNGTHAGSWTYGLPELAGQREVIAQDMRVANPGCYATAISLAYLPAVHGAISMPESLQVVAASGTSGAGRTLSDTTLASNVMGSISAYKVGGVHQHIPEIEQTLNSLLHSQNVRLSFTPLLAPMPRGIVAICHSNLSNQGTSEDDVREMYVDYYRDREFVNVLHSGDLPATGAVLGSNRVDLSIHIDSHSNHLVVISVLDNLMKGAAGQAIQNANIMAGLPEGMGLSSCGIAP